MGVTAELARFAAQTRLEDLSPGAVAATKAVVLDVLGCAIGAAGLELTSRCQVIAGELGGRAGGASVFTSGWKSSMGAAAFANANAAALLDYGDGYVSRAAYLWGGTATVPAAMAVGEAVGATGAQLLSAVATGFEVGARISDALAFPDFQDAVRAENVAAVIAAAVAAAAAGRSGPEAMLSAIGMASATMPVATLQGYIGAEAHPVRDMKQGLGWRSLMGVLAARSAAAGLRMVQPGNALDGEHGFWEAFRALPPDPSELLGGLGQDPRILRTHTKRHPGGGMSHGAIDLVRDLVARHGLRVERIVRIDIMLDEMLGQSAAIQSPSGPVDAQFSVPFQVAVAISGVEEGPAWYAPDTLADPRVLELAGRIFVIADPECTEAYRQRRMFMTRATISMADGSAFTDLLERSERLRDPRLYAGKFRGLARQVISGDRVEQIIGAVDGLESAPDLTRLADLLRAPA